MSRECINFRNQIPRAYFGDLSPEEQQALTLHLAECTPCSQEQSLYAETFRQMRQVEDIPVPRHFLVYSEQRRMSPWQLLRQMSLAWQCAVATAVIALGILSVLAATNMQVRAENGALTLSFGKPAVQPVAAPASTAANAETLKAEILRTAEQKSREEMLEWVRTLRAEIARSSQAQSERGRTLFETALASLEGRLRSSIAAAASNMENKTQESVEAVYRTISLQRERDLNVINTGLNQLAISGEIKSDQTDAILETLLEVAEMRMR